MEILEKLSRKLQDIVNTITHEDHEQWMSHPCTRALLKGLEVDEQDLKDQWGAAQFSSDVRKDANAQGQIHYIEYHRQAIHSMIGARK